MADVQEASALENHQEIPSTKDVPSESGDHQQDESAAPQWEYPGGGFGPRGFSPMGPPRVRGGFRGPPPRGGPRG